MSLIPACVNNAVGVTVVCTVALSGSEGVVEFLLCVLVVVTVVQTYSTV